MPSFSPAASVWAATAAPGPDLPAFTGERRADVAIVGAGFTGLVAALTLARGGASVIVVDTVEPGFGASGRNGGQVIPGLKDDPDTLDRVFGEATTAFAGGTADLVFSLIDELGIDCDPVRGGWIQASVKHLHLPRLESRMAQWRARGAAVDMLDAAGMAAATGGRGFVGGWIDRRGGSVHPLAYARGLARAALEAGAEIFRDAEAVSIARGTGGWVLGFADGGRLTAGQVVIATNGYTGRLWPGLKATVIPANSIQVATAPLPQDLLARILPGRPVVSDSRRIANYFRIGPEGRLMMGGRGAFREPRDATDYRRIEAALAAFYPEAARLPVGFRWAGRVAMTRDHLPHIHQPAAGVTMALGYNGRGVALASAMGRAIGAHLLDAANPLPLALSAIKPMPVHGLHPLYATAMIEAYRVRDMLER